MQNICNEYCNLISAQLIRFIYQKLIISRTIILQRSYRIHTQIRKLYTKIDFSLSSFVYLPKY